MIQEINETVKALNRYTEKCITENLDPDFAKAVQDAKCFLIDLKDCRNELCLRCGDYKNAHKGACDDCRWRDA